MSGRLLLLALLAGVLAGCTNPDAAYREEAAQAFRTNLVVETERLLAEAGGVLTLSNALEQLLDVQVAALFYQMAVAERRVETAAARAWAEAARLDYEAAARRYEDGNETLSSVLDKLAVSEDADTKLAESAYGEAIADVLLCQAVGIDVIECTCVCPPRRGS